MMSLSAVGSVIRQLTSLPSWPGEPRVGRVAEREVMALVSRHQRLATRTERAA